MNEEQLQDSEDAPLTPWSQTWVRFTQLQGHERLPEKVLEKVPEKVLERVGDAVKVLEEVPEVLSQDPRPGHEGSSAVFLTSSS